MPQQSTIHATFLIERSYPASPQSVFAAFADPAKKRRWFAEGPNKEIDEFELDFRTGGYERARYRYREGTPFTGVAFLNEGSYQHIVPDRLIVSSSTMTIGGNCISASLITVELLPSGEGTDLLFTFQGAFFEGSDGAQIREAGWRKLLDRLATELEGQ